MSEETEVETEVADTWLTRLVAEGDELHTKLTALRNFLASDAYTQLPAGDRDLLKDQESFMGGYLKILSERRSRATQTQQAVAAEPVTGDPPEPDEPDTGAEA